MFRHRRDSNSRPSGQVLSTTPRVKVLFRWATGEGLTNCLPELSLVILSPSGTAGYSGPDRI